METGGWIIRPAHGRDAEGIAAVLEALVKVGKRNKRSDAAFALSHYIEHPSRIQCVVAAASDGEIVGFQSLKMSLIGNEYGTPPGWAIIGTHVSPKAARRGIGKALFQATCKAAQASGVPAIEAFVGVANAEGQDYYDAMGFRNYRTVEGAVCKSIDVLPRPNADSHR